MIDVEMSDDIRKYEIKTMGPFTTRQLVCIIIAVILGAPIFFFDFTIDTKIIVASILAIPPLLCGWIKIDGATFEVIAMRYIYLKFLTPAKRKFISKNSYREKLDVMKKQEEQQMLQTLPPAQQKRYLKNKEKKLVKYSNNKACKVYR